MANNPYKSVTSIISTKQESSTVTSVPGNLSPELSALTYTLCDRTEQSKEANYFISFRLPHTQSKLTTGSTLSLQNPELQQLNVDKMIISSIPRESYNEMIDGRSIKFTVPQTSGSGVSGMTVVSSTYSQLKKFQNSTLLGNNIAFLFADEINLPRLGTTGGGNTSVLPRTTWDVTPFVNKPVAHAYSDLQSSDINSDTRAWSGVNLAVTGVTEVYPTNTNQGYNYDIPVGFVSLDKGFVVLTHPDIVDNIPWGEGNEATTGSANTSSGTTDIYFTGGSSVSELIFSDIDINFRTSVVCLALPGEFTFSTNPSWNLAFNIQELNNGTNGFDSVQVTEIGLYNKNSELIAIAKMDRPIEKTYTNLITFNLDIDV